MIRFACAFAACFELFKRQQRSSRFNKRMIEILSELTLSIIKITIVKFKVYISKSAHFHNRAVLYSSNLILLNLQKINFRWTLNARFSCRIFIKRSNLKSFKVIFEVATFEKIKSRGLHLIVRSTPNLVYFNIILSKARDTFRNVTLRLIILLIVIVCFRFDRRLRFRLLLHLWIQWIKHCFNQIELTSSNTDKKIFVMRAKFNCRTTLIVMLLIFSYDPSSALSSAFNTT